MCGIAGIIDFKSDKSNDRGLLLKMIDRIRHRGPDATGIYAQGPAGLAHARLSIIDLSGGDQPIHNEDNTVWIVFNGEIFNYPELRADLEARGHRFYTQTDTEMLVHMYEEYGTDMFRISTGSSPLPSGTTGNRTCSWRGTGWGSGRSSTITTAQAFVFGSEIKAIFADPTSPRCMDLQTLRDVFTCWSPLDAVTSFEGIRQLPAAHYAVFTHAA